MNNLTPLTPLVLDPAAKVAEGVERQIYVHPEDPTRLIKIMKARPTERYTRWTFSHLTKRYMPSTRYRAIAKQYDEFRRVMFTHHLDPDFIPPICHLYGFVPTTLGLGGVTERVTDRAGNNAPTLSDMAGAISDAELAALNVFIARLYDLAICASDLNPANFVYGYRHIGAAGQRMGPEWVLVDGFGDRTAIPITALSALIRRFALDDGFRRAKPVKGLRWDRARRAVLRRS